VVAVRFPSPEKEREDGSTDFNLKKQPQGAAEDSETRLLRRARADARDDDHIRNSADFFELRHAAKYQGGDRTKVSELWVPASITSTSLKRVTPTRSAEQSRGDHWRTVKWRRAQSPSNRLS